MMRLFRLKLITLVLATLSFANIVLVSILFYLMVPLISPNTNINNAPVIAETIMFSVNPDALVYWSVNLESNSRTAITFRVKNQADSNNLITFINVGQLMSFSNSVSAPIVQRLLSGQSICYQIQDAGILAMSIIKAMVQGYPDAMGCVIPNKNRFGSLNGYILLLWKNPIKIEHQAQIISQVESILLKQR